MKECFVWINRLACILVALGHFWSGLIMKAIIKDNVKI